MSTPSTTPGTPTPAPAPKPAGPTVAATAGVTAAAEVVKKNSLRYSPRHLDPTDALFAQGNRYACIEVASGGVVKAFPDEKTCQEFTAGLNAE